MKKFLKRTGIVILILLGLVLVFNQQIMEFTVGKLSENQIENVTKKNIKKSKNADADFNFDNVKSISPQVVGKGMLGGFPVLGKISVPSVGVELPIGKGIGEGVLNQGAGTMKPDQKMGEGNYSLAGHHCTW